MNVNIQFGWNRVRSNSRPVMGESFCFWEVVMTKVRIHTRQRLGGL